MIKDGLYLFPDGEAFTRYGYYKTNVIEFGSANYGSQLIDFLDFDVGKIVKLKKSIGDLSDDEIITEVCNISTDSCKPFLIQLMVDENWKQAYILSSEDNGEAKFKDLTLNTLNSVISTYDKIWELADYYCERYGSAEERFDIIHAASEPFTTMYVEQIIGAKKAGKDFFVKSNKDNYCFPYTYSYRFEDLYNFVQFIFLNTMQYNYNFCKCNYCYNFFIPKTKKLTRFCDRVNSETGKSCKEIAPTVFRNDDIGSTKIMKEYDRALRRNYKRMCRAEERMTGKQSDKDIEPQLYNDWRDRVLMAMRQWKAKEISDGEFMKVIREFD